MAEALSSTSPRVTWTYPLDDPGTAIVQSLFRGKGIHQTSPYNKGEGRSLQSNIGNSAGGEGRCAQPYPSIDGEQSADLSGAPSLKK